MTNFHLQPDNNEALFGKLEAVLLDFEPLDSMFILDFNDFIHLALIILLNPVMLFSNSQRESIMERLCRILAKQNSEFESILGKNFLNMDAEDRKKFMLHLVGSLHQFIHSRIVHRLPESSIYHDQNLSDALRCLNIICMLFIRPFVRFIVSIDDLNEKLKCIPYYDFYNGAIEGIMEVKDDYPRWKTKEGYFRSLLSSAYLVRFSFCDFPFVLSTNIKNDTLRVECLINMRHELQDAFFRAMFIGVNNPYLQRTSS